MNKLPIYVKIVEKEVMKDTVENKDDLVRIIYRISTARKNPCEETMREICEHLIVNEVIDYDYKAIAFFFWNSTQPVGEVAARASLTYAPSGSWEDAFDSSDPMELVLDFDNYCDHCGSRV